MRRRGARDTHRAQDGPRQHALPRCQEAGSGRSRSARPGPAPASCSFTVAAVFLSFPIRRLRHARLCIRSLPTACGEPDWEAPDLRQASCEREVRFECADSVSVPTAHTVLTSPKALHTRQTAARRKQDWEPKHSCDSLCCATYCTAVVRNRTPTCLGAAWVEMGARHHTSARTRTAQRPERTTAQTVDRGWPRCVGAGPSVVTNVPLWRGTLIAGWPCLCGGRGTRQTCLPR